MYEQLIANLRAVEEYDTGYAKLIWDAADAIEVLSKKEKTTSWIPVTERLPSYGDWVLGIGPKNGYYVCEYRGMSHFVYGGDSPWFSSKGKAVNITHWMPLPEPPKEET